MQLQDAVVSASSMCSPYRVMSLGWTLNLTHTHRGNEVIQYSLVLRSEVTNARQITLMTSS